MQGALRARWFDGRSSQARPVLARLEPGARGPALLLQPLPETGAEALRIAAEQIRWPEAWSAARGTRPAMVDLGDQGSLQVDDGAALQAALQAAGRAAPLAQRMQTRWRVFALVAVVAAAGLAAFYRWGTPWAATQLTRQVPLAWETGLAERALANLDAGWLKPSKLPAARQAELRARFDALAARIAPGLRRYGGYAPRLTLQFRSGMGPNAFALPGGSIVMTDALVEAAAARGLPDDALVGVLAHEIGHVLHRHTTRLVVEQGVLNVGLGLALGDVSSLVSMGASALTGLAYRRGHETEADCFALALLREARLPAVPMADLLLALDKGERAAGHADGGASAGWTEFLSSHPATPERAARIRRGQAGC